MVFVTLVALVALVEFVALVALVEFVALVSAFFKLLKFC